MPHNDLVQSLIRGLDILEIIVRDGDGIALKDISERLELKRPTAYNLLRTLTAKGFLVKHGSPPRYAPGAALSELLNDYSRRDYLRRGGEAVSSLFEEIQDATVSIAECVAGQIVSVLRMSPERPGFLERPQGRVLHPYGSASALVFQAYWGADEREGYRQRHLFWEHGAHIWENMEQLDHQLAEIREQGCASPSLGDGVFVAAAPVMGRGGDVVAALGIAMPTDKLAGRRRKSIIARARVTALAISRPQSGE